MLCSQNTGKYVSNSWHAERALATEDTDNFTSEQLKFLELDGTLDGILGKIKQYDDTLTLDSCPVDPLDTSIEYDFRDNPEVN